MEVLAPETPITTVIMVWGDRIVEELPYRDGGAAGDSLFHQYAQGGTCHLTATIRDEAGRTATAETYIVLNSGGANFPPVAAINCAILAGNRVHCDPDTSYDPDGMIVEYQWEVPELGLLFNDETIAFDLPANIPPMGIQVLLAVVDNAGASAMAETFVGGNSSANIPPTAIINCQITGLQVSCDAESSYDSDGMVTQYNWSIAEMTDSSDMATFQFALPMSGFVAHVNLTVTDNLGATSSTVQTVSGVGGGENLPPVAAFYCQTGYQGNPLTIECFADETTDPENQLANLQWNLGDGSTAFSDLMPPPPCAGCDGGLGGPLGGSNPFVSGKYLRYTYPIDGNYTITLRAYDSVSNMGEATHSYDVGNVTPPNLAPVAVLSCSSPAPLIISCDPWMSYDPDGYIISYELKIGIDGEFTSGINVEYFSAAPGDYEITLRVTDNLGTQAVSLPVTVHVVENQAPVAALSCVVPDGVDSPFYVECNTSASVDNDGTIIERIIDWGDNTSENVYWGNAGHLFAIGGPKLITLTVRDNLNAEGTTNTTINLNNPPVAAFTCFHIKALTIKCDASTSTDDENIASYAWNLGGIQKSGAVITQEFLNEQSMTISLTVTDDRGLQNSQDQYFYVQLDPDIKLPVADFEHSIDANNLVHFDAEASLFDGRIITKFTWDLGNGEIRETTTHVLNYSYPIQGRFTAGLVVTDQNDVTSPLFTQEIRVYTPNIADPGISGEQTLEGIDANNDGLRDDLERWIDEYYGENTNDQQNKRNALRQYATTVYSNLLETPNETVVRARASQEVLDYRCILAFFADSGEANRTSKVLKALNYNTTDRLNRYLTLDQFLQTDLNIPNATASDFKNECQFEILP